MKENLQSGSLDHIVIQMTSILNLRELLTLITQGLVQDLDASLAHIWLLGQGDICPECSQKHICHEQKNCLHLREKSSYHPPFTEEYQRIPLADPIIGRIAQDREPLLTNDLSAHAHFSEQEWIKEGKLRACAFYPLIFRNELLGVMGMFSRRCLTQNQFDLLAVFAGHAAIAIKNAMLFSEVDQLKNRLAEENNDIGRELGAEQNFGAIIGDSEIIAALLRKVEQVAPTEATVLLLGETGTGKELLAQAIHSLSRRNLRPLIKVNCAALSPTLIESQLFGHEKGAFTGAQSRILGRFELADGGTIFLDEIGDLPIELQTKLLRVLEEGTFERLGGQKSIQVDVRVIAATNQNLAQAIAAGKFREDLYFRLNIFPLVAPPLRSRQKDIPQLIEHFLTIYSPKAGKTFSTICPQTIATLQAYSWPGNVRELENIIERAAILSPSGVFTVDMDSTGRPPLEKNTLSQESKSFNEMQRSYILKVLQSTGWTIEGPHGAAKQLDLNPSTLRSRMQRLGLHRPDRLIDSSFL
jgi:transcriptional regulator with GAF, ATPase, and Fis domain